MVFAIPLQMHIRTHTHTHTNKHVLYSCTCSYNIRVLFKHLHVMNMRPTFLSLCGTVCDTDATQKGEPAFVLTCIVTWFAPAVQT
jgi:hypothetical protein